MDENFIKPLTTENYEVAKLLMVVSNIFTSRRVVVLSWELGIRGTKVSDPENLVVVRTVCSAAIQYAVEMHFRQSNGHDV